jgi:hypothetical protein
MTCRCSLYANLAPPGGLVWLPWGYSCGGGMIGVFALNLSAGFGTAPNEVPDAPNGRDGTFGVGLTL